MKIEIMTSKKHTTFYHHSVFKKDVYSMLLFCAVSPNISRYCFVSYFDRKRDDAIYSTTWDPPEEILNGCNISKFKIITYFQIQNQNTIYIQFISAKL